MSATATPSAPMLDEVALDVRGMDCASCVAHVQKAAVRDGGAAACDVSLARGRAVVRFDPQRTTPTKVAAAITDSGYPAAPESADVSAGNVEEQRLLRQREEANAWFRRAVAGVILWLPLELTHHLTRLIWPHAHHGALGNVLNWVALFASTIGIVFVGKGFYAGAWRGLRRRTTNMDTLIAMGATVAYLYSLIAFTGYQLRWWTALPELYFMESTGLLALISVGHWLEARARDSAGSAIRELLDLAPAVALKMNDEAASGPVPSRLSLPVLSAPATQPYTEVPVSTLEVGDRVLVRPGDRVPIDGVVVEGRSDVDESMISGEPLPVVREPGDAVIGGTVNQSGRLVVRATGVGGQTALAQIVKLVETAQSSKPPVQQLADRIAAIFVPTVLCIALVTGIGWWAWGHGHHWETARTWGMLAKAVCSVLIIACPCALGLALPAALMVGTGRGAKRGILIRDIDALQHAERIDTVVLDKTGTITRGKPVVVEVTPLNGSTKEEVLRLAASAEQFSEHPLAKAIVAAAREGNLKLTDPQSFSSEAGYGVTARLEGELVLVGNADWIANDAGRGTGFQPVQSATGVDYVPSVETVHRPHGLETRATGAGQSIVHVARKRVNGAVEPLGRIAIADEIKPDSVAAIGELHRMGMRTVLLTGDNRATAEAIAKLAGIDEVRANVKPAGKAAVIRELQRGQREAYDREINAAIADAKSRGADVDLDRQAASRIRHVAMVGDGINDAPALAAADLGIAIGSGSDIAKETGGIVLVSGSLHGIAAAIRLSRATMRTIRQNLFLAFIYNVLAIPLAAFGLLNPLIAAAAMALSDVTVIGNALLLRRK